MKKIIAILLALMAGTATITAQTKYLVNTLTPTSSLCYTAYKYNGPSSKQIEMSGGLSWYGGFTIGSTVGPYRPGYATFELGGKYETLLLVLGHATTNTGAGGSGIDTDPRIFTIHADGRKILDTKIYPYGIPERIRLDVRGVNELKFSIVVGAGPIAVAEATLWTSGQTPVETGNKITAKPVTTRLVTELRPYFNNYIIKNVSPTDKLKSISINGRTYTTGLRMDMSMAIIGNNPGWSYFNLRKQYSKLSFIAGPIDDTEHRTGSGWLTVKADDRIIFEKEIQYSDIAEGVVLDVEGCEMLSFHSEQSSRSTAVGVADITVYPAGVEPHVATGTEASIDPRLKSLPDVCKLISNIPPYTAGAMTSQQIYDGRSDYITFSMGGEKFSEGIVLYQKVSILNDDTSAYAVFDLGNEFDYASFTAGYIGKSGAMNNDVLRVYADDEMVLEAPLIATQPNQKYVVPLNRCRKLRFENQGVGSLDVAAFGVGDIVVYRGEPVENDLFARPKPDCPYTIDLIDLGAPYIHYVSPMSDHKDEIFYDGSTLKKYFDLNGQRIYKGFMLQTSVHFSLDHGVLSGSDGAAAGAIGGTAVGSAFVAGGVAVGGAVVGSTLIGVAAFLMLAAGGEALENSCAAFNTYGEYNSVTFTVACCHPYIRPDDYTETLLIGADHKVVAQIALYETMEPQTITVPIDGCEQLMFWLANTDNWSGQFIFYDIKLTKDHLPLDIPRAARLSQAVVTQPEWNAPKVQSQWERPASSGQKEVDDFFWGVTRLHEKVSKAVGQMEPKYEIYTYYLETDAGVPCRAVTLESTRGENLNSITRELEYALNDIKTLKEIKNNITDLSIGQASAGLGLVELGFKGISYGKLLKAGGSVLKECKAITEQMYNDKVALAKFLQTVVNGRFDADGKTSTDTTILCPLAEGETPPTNLLQQVKHFTFK